VLSQEVATATEIATAAATQVDHNSLLGLLSIMMAFPGLIFLYFAIWMTQYQWPDCRSVMDSG